MGFTPAQVDEMSLWEFAACRDAYAKHNGAKTAKTGEIEDERLRELGIEGF